MNERSDQPAIDALYRIIRVVSSTEDPKEALELIIDEIMNVLPADSAAVELINPDHNSLEVEVYRGFPRSLESTQLKVGAGLTGWVAYNGKALNIGNVKKDPRYIEVDPRIVSELVVPLCRDDGSVIGVVNVDSYKENAFSKQDKKVLTLMASEATRVLSRLWLIQKLRQTAHQLEVLIDIAQSVVAKRQLDEILQTITSRSMEIIPCSLSAIFLKDDDEDTLSLRASSGEVDTVDENETIAFADSAIGTAFTRNKTIEITDLPRIEENHFSSLIQEKNLASMISCPITFENQAIGVLNIYTNYAHRFNNTEKRVFETLASLGATAIRNAQLYARIFKSEENLRRSERLTTLGLLSAEIAHEIRNPLTVIQLLFESLALDFAEEDPRQKDVQIIQEKLGQLESIVSRVLSFGKSQQEMHYRCNVNKLIEDTLHLVRLKLRQSRVELVFNHDPTEPPFVDVNKGQIQQAILNLLINATQVMTDGGRIEISTTVESDEENDVAVIRISDSGTGIDPGIQETIFDSFLTGRPDGTGLGLSIVKRILKSHSGSISVESSSSEGTTMKMVLPLATSRR
ncbi:MAG: GAF domain-containing protein [Puniceicoccaceae bacterium]